MSLENTTVLAVDDNEDALELISGALTPHGCHVICAASGPQAVQILHGTVPDAIVLDIMMPDMNGFAVLDVVRRTPGLEHVPVILQTADPSRQHGERTVNSGLTHMLAKPLDIDVLARVVGNCIRARQQGVKT